MTAAVKAVGEVVSAEATLAVKTDVALTMSLPVLVGWGCALGVVSGGVYYLNEANLLTEELILKYSTADHLLRFPQAVLRWLTNLWEQSTINPTGPATCILSVLPEYFIYSDETTLCKVSLKGVPYLLRGTLLIRSTVGRSALTYDTVHKRAKCDKSERRN